HLAHRYLHSFPTRRSSDLDVVDQHFMLQKEVVDRMAAGPGGKDYGRLSVMLQWRYDIESVLDVPPEAFDPPPRVDSAIVRMLPLDRKSTRLNSSHVEISYA